MMLFARGIGLAMAILALVRTTPAQAQENLDSGKTGAQLFASNCALCHKSAQALNKSGGLLGLSGFLREHYTASRESASAIASYLESVGNVPAPGKRKDTKRTPNGDEKAKLGEKKDKADKSEKSEKSGKAGKPDEAKPSESKSESKVEPKGETKSESKKEPKASEPKSDKPEKPEKSD